MVWSGRVDGRCGCWCSDPDSASVNDVLRLALSVVVYYSEEFSNCEK